MAASKPRTSGLRLDDVGDNALLVILVRAPFSSHVAIRMVSKRLNELMSSDEFREERIESGYAESGVLLVGGKNERCGNHAECWLWTKGAWRPIAALSTPRGGCPSLLLDGEMWVLGGCFDESSVQMSHSTVIYNPAANCWRAGPDACRDPRNSGVGVVDGKIVLAGGINDAAMGKPRWLCSADAYSPETGWTELPCVPDREASLNGCVIDDKLFVSTSTSLAVWDGKSWSARAKLPGKKSKPASVVYGGKLWLIGGLGRHEAPSNEVFIFNPATNSWETGPALPDRGQRVAPDFDREVAVEYEGAIIYIGSRRALRLDDGVWSEQPMPPMPVIAQRGGRGGARGRRGAQPQEQLGAPCLQAVFFG